MQNKQFKIRNMLFLEEDRKIDINLDNEKFIIKALFPKEKANIAKTVAFLQNGLPANSFSDMDRFMFERQATIDEALIEYPDWWKGAEDCPLETFLNTLYEEIVEWTNLFQENLKKNKLNKRSPEGQIPG